MGIAPAVPENAHEPDSASRIDDKMTTEPQTSNSEEQTADANGYELTANNFPSRIVVVGTTGSGKTTTVLRIAEIKGW